jgi:2-amino-4-hydroxy-6-hydroxymethyldihydropteridine diphosphokinase
LALREPVRVYIGLGANLGHPAAMVRSALDGLASLPHTTLVAVSHLYRSTPVDSGGPDYVNAVAALDTRLTAPALLAGLQAHEQQAGRDRPYRNAPRTLDLDLLLFGSARISSPALTVPHPRMAGRAFVLLPLAEIAPDVVPEAWLRAVDGQGVWRFGS